MLSIILALSAVPAVPSATVVIHGVASGKGRVSVALCTRDSFMRRCALSRIVPAKRGDVAVAFPAPSPGRYAVMAFHDENGNGKLDRGAMGIPTEGHGFSRNATGEQGPPSFDAAAVTVSRAGGRFDLDLRY